MREKIIAHGLTCGKWIAIEEAPPTCDGRRYMICRCMACGSVTIIRLDKLRDPRRPIVTAKRIYR